MHRQTILAFLFSLLLGAAAQARANEVDHWNRVATDACAAAKADPLTESRVLAIVHLSIHSALSAAEPNASPEAAVAAAAHASLVALMPERRPAFDRALADTLETLSDRRAAFAGLKVGRKAAAAALEQRL